MFYSKSPLLRVLAVFFLISLFARPVSAKIVKVPAVILPGVLNQVEHRAFLFFWQQSSPETGLTLDRASNNSPYKKFTIASIASTGYALASLPIAVTHQWITNKAAYHRALITLNFAVNRLSTVHGWYYHFVDINSGVRQWKCEVSSIDTALLLQGALIDSAFWPHSRVQRLADQIYQRIDWHWMLTNGGRQPNKLVLSMGWHPEKGFIHANWDSYCELMTLLMPALGAPHNPPPSAIWHAWKRPVVNYQGLTTLAGGPIFIHEMAQEFYDFRGKRDPEGWNYYATAKNGILINRAFCIAHASTYAGLGPNCWGLNANDAPDGYSAYGAPQGPIDGTISPTGAIAAIETSPSLAISAAKYLRSTYGDKAWGRYGFPDSINPSHHWYDSDVIGIDLGMAMLAIENVRSGLPWHLVAELASTKRAFRRAGFRVTHSRDVYVASH